MRFKPTKNEYENTDSRIRLLNDGPWQAVSQYGVIDQHGTFIYVTDGRYYDTASSNVIRKMKDLATATLNLTGYRTVDICSLDVDKPPSRRDIAEIIMSKISFYGSYGGIGHLEHCQNDQHLHNVARSILLGRPIKIYYKEVPLLKGIEIFKNYRTYRDKDEEKNIKRLRYLRAFIRRYNITDEDIIKGLDNQLSWDDEGMNKGLKATFKKAGVLGIKPYYVLEFVKDFTTFSLLKDYLNDLQDVTLKEHLKKYSIKNGLNLRTPSIMTLHRVHDECNRKANSMTASSRAKVPRPPHIVRAERWLNTIEGLNVSILDSPGKLRAEGKNQGHCIGRKSMGYLDQVARQEAVAVNVNGTTAFLSESSGFQASDRFNKRPDVDVYKICERITAMLLPLVKQTGN